LAPGIDVRGDGGMVIAPPSIRTDGAYRCLNDEPIADAPQWLLDMVVGQGRQSGANGGQHPTDANGPQPSFTVNRRTIKAINDAAMANFGAWVPNLFPDAIETDGKWRITSAALGRDLQEDISITPEGIVDFGVHDQGDPRRGKRTPIELVQAWLYQDQGQAAEWLRAKLGLDLQDETGNEVDDLNTNYALVIIGDKTAVMNFEDETKFRLLQVGSFKQWFSNRKVTIGDKVLPLAEYWLKHPQRRQYEGIEFAPVSSKRGYYNLWHGFAVEPRQGDCQKFLDHLKNNVCNGNEEHYKWIVGWFAQIVQQPGIKTETSLVLRGKMGVGKTKVGEVIGSLFGEHYLLVADPRYIIGRFNSHMASLLLLHADEAFWAGDREAEGKLKDLVSGKQHLIEMKGKEAFVVNNLIRFFVTGNPDWLVPAGFTERRFAVFDVDDRHIQDHAYFAAIDEQMNNGGREALLHHLKNFNLSTVNLRVIPKTTALLEQKIKTATPEQAWWLDTLKRGELPWGTDEPTTCVKKKLFLRYIKHASRQGVRRRAIEVMIGMFLKKYVGANLRSDERLSYRVHTPNRGIITKRDWCFRFPPLNECRDRFAEELQQDITWENLDEEWHHEEEVIDDDEEF
jgi:hypothetical protein